MNLQLCVAILLLSKQCQDWGTATATCGLEVCFTLCHQILPQCLDDTFRGWEHAGQEAQPDGGDGPGDIEQLRAYMRSKAWRSKKVMVDKDKQITMSAVSFCAIPVDFLLQRIQRLDAKGCALVDCASDKVGHSPILQCRQALARMACSPTVTGPARSLLQHHHADFEPVLSVVRQVTLSLATHFWWRSAVFAQWPLRFAALLSGIPRSEQEQILSEFFAAKPCCLDPEFSSKMSRLFRSPSELLDNEKFMMGLRLWSKVTKVTNMHLERLLSLTKRSLGQKDSPEVERLISIGMMAQILSKHLAAGGADPRFTTRAMLLQAGAPIRVAEHSKPPTGSKPSGPFFAFRGERLQLRLDRHGPLKRLAAKAEMRDIRRDWRGMSEEGKSVYISKSKEEWLKKKVEQEQQVEEQLRRDDAHASRLTGHCSGLGSWRWPITPEEYEQGVRELMGLQQDDVLPGIRACSDRLRKKWLEEALVTEDGW